MSGNILKLNPKSAAARLSWIWEQSVGKKAFKSAKSLKKEVKVRSLFTKAWKTKLTGTQDMMKKTKEAQILVSSGAEWITHIYLFIIYLIVNL